MQIGELWSGSITPDQVHNWTFQGQNGQSIRLQAFGEEETADTVLRLYNPNGREIAYSDDDGDGLDAEINYILNASGEYRVQFPCSAHVQDNTTVYLSQVNTRSGDCSREQYDCGFIAVGDRSEGSLTTSNRQSWRFNAEAGQTITITVNGRGNIRSGTNGL